MKPRSVATRAASRARFLSALFLWLLAVGTLPAQTPTDEALDLRDAPLHEVVRRYQQLCDRTCLVHPVVRGFRVTLQMATTNRAAAALALEQVFASNNVVVIQDGAKFAQLLPTGMTNEARLFASTLASNSTEVYFQPGNMNFTGAEVQMVAQFYAGARQRKLNPESFSPTARDFYSALKAPIFFLNHTALTRAEFIHAMDVFFAWHRLKFEPDGEEFLKPARLVP